jgi:hypothetical protein
MGLIVIIASFFIFFYHGGESASPQNVNPFLANSKCNKAVDFFKYGYLRDRLPKKSRVNINIKNPSLQIINPGKK